METEVPRKFFHFTIPETFMAILILLAIGFGVGVGLVFNLTDQAYKSVVAPVVEKAAKQGDRLTTIETELGIQRKDGVLPPAPRKGKQ